MDDTRFRSALIIGAGPGISASFARLLARNHIKVVLVARQAEKLAALEQEIGGLAISADATDAADMRRVFMQTVDAVGAPEIVLYNVGGGRLRGALVDLDPKAVLDSLAACAYGGFLVGQEAARLMLARPVEQRGAILFTGASASVKGYARSAPFAMGKFALRGLAQSMARELAPQGIHVAHFVIDGAVRNPARPEPAEAPDSMLDPDAVAQSYWHVLHQPRSAWSWEVELRPWVENF